MSNDCAMNRNRNLNDKFQDCVTVGASRVETKPWARFIVRYFFLINLKQVIALTMDQTMRLSDWQCNDKKSWRIHMHLQ